VLRRGLLATLGLLAIATSSASSADGWYLMSPPWRADIKLGEDELDTTAPLTKWQHIRAFDAAHTCENARLQTIKMLEKGDAERLDKAAESLLRHPGSNTLQTSSRGSLPSPRARWACARRTR
jgi:hypothetical protein